MNDLREKIAKILERHDFAGDDWWDNVGDLFSLFTELILKRLPKEQRAGISVVKYSFTTEKTWQC